MSQTFTVSIVLKDGVKWWLTSDKGLTNEETKAFNFKHAPHWRKIRKRFGAKTVSYSEVEFTPHGDVK